MRQTELIQSSKPIIRFNFHHDEELYLIRQFYHSDKADELFDNLLNSLDWGEEHLFIYGRHIKVPRLLSWYGDPDAYYRYSGVDHQPKPWTDELRKIKLNIESECNCRFNSVLANLYRDGNDSMGCHADNEKELGVNPVIASLSLGDERLFKLNHLIKKDTFSIPLGHGDLLVMAGTFQHHWLHSIPKTKKKKSPRINLTLRRILPT